MWLELTRASKRAQGYISWTLVGIVCTVWLFSARQNQKLTYEGAKIIDHGNNYSSALKKPIKKSKSNMKAKTPLICLEI